MDQCSDTDLGAFHGKYLIKNSETALEELGRLIPHGWLWTANAFYDNRPGKWASNTMTKIVDYKKFKIQAEIASKENSLHQEATEMNHEQMVEARDSDNCFRIVELGISDGSDVVILGMPYNGNSGKSNSLNALVSNHAREPPFYVFEKPEPNNKELDVDKEMTSTCAGVITIDLPSTHHDDTTVHLEKSGENFDF